MERCLLTQNPCRKAIAEIIKANKNRYFLQRTLEVAEIIEFYIDLCYITGRCVGNHAPLLYTTI